MAEPQPQSVQEGDTTALQPVTGGKDGAKAAAALSSLDQTASSAATDPAPKKELDTKALGDAIAQLELASGSAASSKATKGGKDSAAAAAAETKKAVTAPVEVKKVKIDAADVAVVVEACELSKARATEVLRAHEGDLGRALRGWVGIAAAA